MVLQDKTTRDNSWALTGRPGPDQALIGGRLPGRWGRMTPLCRLMIYEVGTLLRAEGILSDSGSCSQSGQIVGLIGATRRGSLNTDRAFLESMARGPGLASPALFGYTLPNSPLAEAASHYGLVGPVYAIFKNQEPLTRSIEEARMLLAGCIDLDLVICCAFDHCTGRDGAEVLDVKLKLVRRNA
jgi:hypothetical protein